MTEISFVVRDPRATMQPLNELLEDDEKFGFIVMDGLGCLYGTLSGNTREVLHRFSVTLAQAVGAPRVQCPVCCASPWRVSICCCCCCCGGCGLFLWLRLTCPRSTVVVGSRLSGLPASVSRSVACA